MRHTRILAALLLLGGAALAQVMIPTPNNATPTNAWTSNEGAVFDGGLSVGAAGTLGADALAVAECESRLVAHGYDNKKSPVVLVLDSTTSRVIGFGMEWVALDAGMQEISWNQTPLAHARYWRHYAGGDGGMPWFYQGSFSTTGSGGPTAKSLLMMSNTGALAFLPGFWCFVPLATGAGVEKVFQRINVVRVPSSNPR